ncbi:death-associated inhibitor of apoptosis 1-like [Argopecten irradians]|uniref:death-associated inhibitor of apoptosis 1-like n=1 Tax=Argopecten irradians TaxID=31199 RepID=UPI0037190CF7
MAYSNSRQYGGRTEPPRHPEYSDVSRRRDSYTSSRKLKHHSQKLAEAGFFYNGAHVQCYVCSRPLRTWHNNALWYPVCQHDCVQTPNDHSTSEEPNSALVNDRLVNVQQPCSDHIPDGACISLAVSGTREEPTRTGTDASVSLTTHSLTCCEHSEPNVQAYYSGRSSIVTSIDSPEKVHCSLRLENRYLKEQRKCKICKEQVVGITFLPCGHLCCCAECAPSVGRCPLCQEPVTDRSKTILPP